MFHQRTCDLGSCDIPTGEHLSTWEHSCSAVTLNRSVYNSGYSRVPSTNSQLLGVCRICLATNCRMFSITRVDLLGMLSLLLDNNMQVDLFSPTICWECRSRLVSASRLKNKARRAQILLTELMRTTQEINIDTVKHLDRSEHGLTSNLSTNKPETIDIDPVKDEAEIVKQESIESTDAIVEDQNTLPVEVLKNEGLSDSSSNLDVDEIPLLQLRDGERRRKRNVRVGAGEEVRSKKKVKKKIDAPTKRNYKPKGELDKILSAGFIIRKLSPKEQREDFEKRKEQDRYLSRDFKCTVCYTAFAEEPKYRNHLLKHEEEWGRYQCSICNRRIKSKKNLNKHVRDCHLAEYSCRECRMVTKNRSVAISHQNGHSGAKYRCPLCPAEFTYRSTYMNHRRINHVSEYVCELCGYAFLNEVGINMHKLKTHPLDKSELTGPYCEACNVTFVSEEAYTKHLALSSKHSSDATRKEIRNDCNYRTLGLKSPNGTRKPPSKMPITCEVCGSVVVGLIAYANHFRKQHPGEKRVQFPSKQPSMLMCDQCGKKFQSYHFLENHLSVHTGVKSFQCDVCLKKFMTKSGLTLHVKRHSANPKKYQCPECGRDFTDQSNLSRHRLIHTELKKYECSFCGKTFKWGESLRMHVKHVHLKVPWPKRDRSARRHTEY